MIRTFSFFSFFFFYNERSQLRVYFYLVPLSLVEYDIKSILKLNKSALNLDFFSPRWVALAKLKNSFFPIPIGGGITVGFMPFPSAKRNAYSLVQDFGWVGFYGISTIVGYLMPNPVFTYILTIWFENTICRYIF